MKRKLIVLLCIICSCNSQHQKSKTTDKLDTLAVPVAPVLDEYFVDSMNMHTKGIYKAEISRYRLADSSWVAIRFFKDSSGQWRLIQQFDFDIYTRILLNPGTEDINNDGYGDYSYLSEEGGRNEIRKLFFFDPNGSQFVYVENGEEYPNLTYDAEHKRMKSIAFEGFSSLTSYLQVQGDKLDKLVETVRIRDDDGWITTYIIDEDGREKEVKKEKSTTSSD